MLGESEKAYFPKRQTIMFSKNVNPYHIVMYHPLILYLSTVPVTMASIKIAGPQPILNHTFSLICETAGDVESIMWMHLGLPLYADNRRNFSTDNTILTFDPVMFSDNGNYKCSASNPLSSLASDNFMLKVICEYSECSFF